MNLKSYLITGAAACALLLVPASSVAGPPVRTNLFSTGFEYHEGFEPQWVLGIQNGWLDLPVYNGEANFDLIPDGVISNRFAGLGQQAWIGGEFITNSVDQVAVWHPTRLDPIPSETPIVKFSVLMSIEDLGTANFDFFRWSVYNSETNRLFSLDFDNFDFSIAYQLDDDVFHPVTPIFITNSVQKLEITMHFSENIWSAWLDGEEIVADAPITTKSQKKTLGEVRALWLPEAPESPGANRMVFDNFSLFAESLPSESLPPSLLALGKLDNGSFAIRLLGDADCRYVIDYSLDSSTWLPIKTNITVDGSFDYVDTAAPVSPTRFFRARLLPD